MPNVSEFRHPSTGGRSSTSYPLFELHPLTRNAETVTKWLDFRETNVRLEGAHNALQQFQHCF